MNRFKGWLAGKLQPFLREVTGSPGPALPSGSAGRAEAAPGPAGAAAQLQEALQALQSHHDAHIVALAKLHSDQNQALVWQAGNSLANLQRGIEGQMAFTAAHGLLLQELQREQDSWRAGMVPKPDVGQSVRRLVRKHAGLVPDASADASQDDLLAELRFLWANSALVRTMLALGRGRRVLFAGQSYYNAWYLSRALRERDWKADVLNWDTNESSQIYYHGEDFRFFGNAPDEPAVQLRFYVGALYDYDVFHFTNAHAISFGGLLAHIIGQLLGPHGEIYLLKSLGRTIVYSNNGCLDGVSQTSFSKWGPESVCAICSWRDEPAVCSDERNLAWGRFRNSVADYQCTLGGNRVDFNDDPRVHEAPGFYCADPEFLHPDLQVPQQFRLARRSDRTLWLYHAVGNRSLRTLDGGINIKSSHIWLPMIDRLRGQGWDIEMLEPHDVPNRDVRFLQVQADIFLEMLTYGWFGANAREAMLLGKPVICYIRPEWLDSVREELPEYARDLPIVSATPETAEAVLLDLMQNPAKRAEIGRRGREFMIRWHSPASGARDFDAIYSRLIAGDPLLRVPVSRASAEAKASVVRLPSVRERS
jgi:hypothetical protein